MSTSVRNLAQDLALPQHSEESTLSLIAKAREAQARWASTALWRRIECIRKFRCSLVDGYSALVSAIAKVRDVGPAEVLVSEIIPLADACRFLEEEAERTLASKVPEGRRPLWLAGTQLKIFREPLGVVLIIAPSNYPLFIAGVQALQAITAGNAVLVKPGRGCAEVLRILYDMLSAAGIDRRLVTVLDDSDDQRVQNIITEGVDKIALTGSSQTGLAVMEAAGKTLTPAIMELSGCDAAFVLAGADAALAAKALALGLLLNRSRTCMRPHRLLVHVTLRDSLLQHLATEFAQRYSNPQPYPFSLAAKRMLATAMDREARVIIGDSDRPFSSPMVLEGVDPAGELATTDAFLPLMILHTFTNPEDALRIYDQCPYALGASIFGPEVEASIFAKKINAGFVLINDVIAPTADPRLPFSGRKRSGFGTTRGAEGLLEFTRVKAISTRHSNYHHLDPSQADDEEFFLSYLHMTHGTNFRQRIGGTLNLIRAAIRRSQSSRSKSL